MRIRAVSESSLTAVFLFAALACGGPHDLSAVDPTSAASSQRVADSSATKTDAHVPVVDDPSVISIPSTVVTDGSEKIPIREGGALLNRYKCERLNLQQQKFHALAEDPAYSGIFEKNPEPQNILVNGDLEKPWPPDQPFPPGWGAAGDFPVPVALPEDLVVERNGKALRLFGRAKGEGRTFIRAVASASAGQLSGKQVVFSAWLFTDQPFKVRLRVVDSSKTTSDVSPTVAGQFQRVFVPVTMSRPCTAVLFGIYIDDSEVPVECIVDDVRAFVLE